MNWTSSPKFAGIWKAGSCWIVPPGCIVSPFGSWTVRHGVRRGRSWIRGARVAALSAGVGLLFLTPLVGDLEEVYGVGALLQLRGPTAPPPDVVLVAIDRASAENLGLPPPPRQWPRALHAKLVDSLASRGAAAIVFDLLFAEDSKEDDKDGLAQAMEAAGNVVLLQGLERRSVSAANSVKGEKPGQNILDVTVDPIAAFRDAAVGIAPFPLPSDSARVTRYWAFRDADVPTLPAVALQVAASDLSKDWAGVLATEDDPLGDPGAWQDRRIVPSMSELRHRLRAAPGEAGRLRHAIETFEPGKAKRLSALLALYVGEDNRLLNLRGPAGTISTLAYDSLLPKDDTGKDADVPQIRGKIVVVGLAEREIPGQPDTYETAYSGKNGINLSGVEILATGVADLMEDRSLRTSALANVLVIFAVALIIGVATASANTLILACVSFVLPFAIFALGYYLFVSANLVIPLFTPTAVELPLGVLFAALFLRNAEMKLRRSIDGAIRQFLPRELADSLAQGPRSPTAVPEGQTQFVVCLETDAEGFMTLSERLSPEALQQLLNEYFPPLFEVIQRYGGVIPNVTGDAMICSWTTVGEPLQARSNAIHAALEMLTLVTAFNARHPASPLPTRFGLHAGFAVLGAIGGAGHFATALIGDVTNTAARIESLNKHLNTRILASEDVLANVDGIVIRRLGTFILAGKAQAVHVAEIFGRFGEDQRMAFLDSFALGLAAYDSENWGEAASFFRDSQREYPDDGPTAYFLYRAERFLQNPPPPGTDRPIRMNVK